MQRIKISQSGPEFSRISLGLWRLAEWHMTSSRLTSFIEENINLGITTFDHADFYGNYTCEVLFGEGLAGKPSLRQKMEIVTKCGIKFPSDNRPENRFHGYDTSQEHIIRSAEKSLQTLRTDYIDVLLIHRPDPLMNADEIAEAFSKLKSVGKVLHFGVSNFLPHQFDLLQSRLDFPLVTNQIEVSVLCSEPFYNGVLDQCQQLRISPMAWSPLAGGRIFTGNGEREQRVRGELIRVGEELGGASPDQVALAWLLKHPSSIIPVIGTSSVDRIKSAVAAMNLELSRDQWFRILVASEGRPVA